MSSVAPSSGSKGALVAPDSLGASGILIALWGAFGVVLLFAQAIHRLGELALEAHRMPLGPGQVALSVVWIGVNAYAEGYRAFQQRFCPRVVARALHLARNPRPLFVLLAPLYCMAFFHATRRARIVAWATSLMVVCFIVLLRRVPQPWRGIVDGGVVVALFWGAAAIAFLLIRAIVSGREPRHSAELPE